MVGKGMKVISKNKLASELYSIIKWWNEQILIEWYEYINDVGASLSCEGASYFIWMQGE